LTSVVLIVLVAVVGASGRVTDAGDAFDRLSAVAKYADHKLAAATSHQALPKAPQLFADLTTVKLSFGTTLVYEALLLTVVGGTTRQTFRGLVEALGLNRFSFTALWRPAIGVVAAYTLIAVYITVVKALGIDVLTPQSTVPDSVTRDSAAMAMAFVAAVIAAPISEEVFFRGFVFSGLLRWGFWPAAACSAALFTVAHLDLGSLIPFFGIGLIMAWLYWSRGSLWDSIVFHFLFNFISLAALLAGR
jgi:membrane protease YdiL (CAAX protease family)